MGARNTKPKNETDPGVKEICSSVYTYRINAGSIWGPEGGLWVLEVCHGEFSQGLVKEHIPSMKDDPDKGMETGNRGWCVRNRESAARLDRRG